MKKNTGSQLILAVLLLGASHMLLYGTSSQQRGKNLQEPPVYNMSVPVGGNSWLISNIKESKKIVRNKSIRNWTSVSDTINTYFYTDKTGDLIVGIRGNVLSGKSKITFSHEGESRVLRLQNTVSDSIYVGRFSVKTPGYQCIQMIGEKRSSKEFAEITHLLIGGESTTGTVHFVRDDFYWGKRGPSVHLSYSLPEKAGDVLWFYNEMTIPEGEDVRGSYFMANGFAQGYFGIQVNSDTERRVLFSVWSPFHTDNPDEIPEDKRIILLSKGESVYSGEFGNEGSGGQSYLKYNWKSGTTYKFLLKGEPREDRHTAFTAWFYAPELGKWQLIASFLRPDTESYLKRLHSFLENFYTETGVLSRRVLYSNQWVCNSDGQWLEMTGAKFTADATARKDARLDYSGGKSGKVFFLENCGFTNHHTVIDSFFEREATNETPEIDFSTLPDH